MTAISENITLTTSHTNVEHFEYDNKTVRNFALASIVFAIVGLLVGLLIAVQLFWTPANVTQYFTFGRIRALHTNAVIFAFVGNAIFAGIYYSLQRLCKARSWSAISATSSLGKPASLSTASSNMFSSAHGYAAT